MEGKMDSNVIEFPTRAVRDWIGYEKVIQKNMQKGGASPEMIKEVCARMKEAFPKFAASFEFRFDMPLLPQGLGIAVQDSINKALEKFREEIHEYTNQVIFDRLRLEIELYNVRHGKT
jgi:hypothetical protein